MLDQGVNRGAVARATGQRLPATALAAGWPALLWEKDISWQTYWPACLRRRAGTACLCYSAARFEAGILP